MTPEQLVNVMVALDAAGAIGILLKMWQHRQERGTKREDDYDQRQQQRIDKLESEAEARDTARDHEIQELRQGIQQCHENHAAARVEVASLKAENQGLQRQIDVLTNEMERRRHYDGPPLGESERRSPDWRR